jgi:hypothetical protein
VVQHESGIQRPCIRRGTGQQFGQVFADSISLGSRSVAEIEITDGRFYDRMVNMTRE